MTELREELRKAREAVQLVKEATETEKQAAYTLGVEETQSQTYRGTLYCMQGVLWYFLR